MLFPLYETAQQDLTGAIQSEAERIHEVVGSAGAAMNVDLGSVELVQAARHLFAIGFHRRRFRRVLGASLASRSACSLASLSRLALAAAAGRARALQQRTALERA